MVPRDVGGEYQKVAVKIAHNSKKSKLFWYLDSKFMGVTSKKHTLFINFKTGWHVICVVDEEGSSKEIKFYTKNRYHEV